MNNDARVAWAPRPRLFNEFGTGEAPMPQHARKTTPVAPTQSVPVLGGHWIVELTSSALAEA
jgi:hypothetical protein